MRKILCALLWNCRGVLSIDFQEGWNEARMNAKKYVAILEDHKNN